MIRMDVEKLRGFTFTEEELKEVIIPALCAKEENVSKENVSKWKYIAYLLIGYQEPTIGYLLLVKDNIRYICKSYRQYATFSQVKELIESYKYLAETDGIPLSLAIPKVESNIAEEFNKIVNTYLIDDTELWRDILSAKPLITYGDD